MKSTNSFTEKVLQIVKAIPVGKVMSYRQVANQAGFPGASRAVGAVMKKNFDPTVPCHRVIAANGEIGNYNRGKVKKVELLLKEGVEISQDRLENSSYFLEG